MTRLTFDSSFSMSVARNGPTHVVCNGPLGQILKSWIWDVHIGYFGRELGAAVSGEDEDMADEARLVELPY